MQSSASTVGIGTKKKDSTVKHMDTSVNTVINPTNSRKYVTRLRLMFKKVKTIPPRTTTASFSV